MSSKKLDAVAEKIMVLNARSDSGKIARIRAEAQAAARAPDEVHSALLAHIPREYAPGALGWTIPIAEEIELDEQDAPTGRVAVRVEEPFARGKSDFSSARDDLPPDWKRGKPQSKPGTPKSDR